MTVLKGMSCTFVKTISLIALGLLVICTAGRELSVDDAGVRSEAAFALRELKKLSDSTIYSTLELRNILSAHEDDGIFHDNIILNVELSSPYFKSGLPSEQFELFVMTHKEDSVKSFAIDEFPEMLEAAIEEYTNKNVALKRMKSEEAFRRLELEALSVSRGEGGYLNPNATVSDLLDALSSDMVTAVRTENSNAILPQLTALYAAQEHELSLLSLGGLYEVTLGGGVSGVGGLGGVGQGRAGDVSDYHMYRARRLLDAVMAHLQAI